METIPNKPEESIRVMVVDDDDKIRLLLKRQLIKQGYDTDVYEDGHKAIEAFHKDPRDIVIVDLVMPALHGLDVLESIKKLKPSTEVIIISGNAHKKDAIRALRHGAFDLLEKPFTMLELSETIKRTVRYQTALRERRQLVRQVKLLATNAAKGNAIEDIVGKSRQTGALIKNIRLMQERDKTTVLINGESGSGKELVARAIHYGGTRATSPFVAVNCCAIPDELAESKLFGHIKGAFTGASSNRKGCFELGEGGTLFLDEIGDMPLSIQSKLLRVLEDGTVTPVGGTRSINVDVRIMAATNADLQAKMAAGTFREDLYYRLTTYSIEVPALRERKDDIPLLVEHFVTQLSAEVGVPAPEIRDDFQEAMIEYEFPGNVRELRNIIERTLIVASGSPLDRSCFQPAGSRASSAAGSIDNASLDSLPDNLAVAEKLLIQRVIKKANGNISEAAKKLGISRAKIYRMID